ncbi:SRPBCC family protein [bacterium]|nr:SRPBCC family protein [bacterium]
MKIITIIIAVLVLAIGGFWLYGSLQPVAYSKTASKDLNMTPLETWFKLHDYEAMGSWHPDIDSVVWANDKYGLNAEYIYYFVSGDSLRIRTTDYEPFTYFATTITDTTLPFSGNWTYELEEIPGGTRLTVTENSEIHGAFIRAIYNLVQSDTSTAEKFLTYFSQL